MKKIKGLSMVLGVILALSSQTTIVKSAVSVSVSKKSAVIQTNEDSILSISRTNAKQIQNVLDQYYEDNDSYPTEKDFNNVIKSKLKGIPKYEDGSLMIKSYVVTSEGLNRAVRYRIEFNDDKTTVYDESQGNNNSMSECTDCSCLFDEDTVENNNLADNRIKAMEIQSALAQCYAYDDTYPSKADFYNKIKTKLGDIPKYKDNTPMIKTYSSTKKGGNEKDEYKIQFNDDKSTVYNESKGANNVMTEVTDTNYLFNGTPEKNILARSRISAKQIQNVLDQYYANYDTYPSLKDFNKVVKSVLGDLPRYQDNTLMVKSYAVSNYDKSNSTYKIVFNNDKSTVYDEGKSENNVMTEHTNTNYLFSGSTIEKNRLNLNKIFAKQIQNALAQYYAENDCYPDEKNFDNVIESKLGAMPRYEGNVPMICKYTAIKNSQKQIIAYKIYFNDDGGTVYKENNKRNELTEQTNVNYIFTK